MALRDFENLGRDLRDSMLRLLRDYSEALVLAILMAVILRVFVFATYKISNPTMEPSLKLGDFIVGYRLPYGLQIPFTDVRFGQTAPRRGEVVIFHCPKVKEGSCVKRVVARAGDRVEIVKGRLAVNGAMAQYTPSEAAPSQALSTQVRLASLREAWKGRQTDILISERGGPNADFGPYIVPPGHFFVLGDNRDFSEDSRHWGAIPVTAIESRALFVWFSIEWVPTDAGGYSGQVRWSRIFDPVH